MTLVILRNDLIWRKKKNNNNNNLANDDYLKKLDILTICPFQEDHNLYYTIKCQCYLGNVIVKG